MKSIFQSFLFVALCTSTSLFTPSHAMNRKGPKAQKPKAHVIIGNSSQFIRAAGPEEDPARVRPRRSRNYRGTRKEKPMPCIVWGRVIEAQVKAQVQARVKAQAEGDEYFMDMVPPTFVDAERRRLLMISNPLIEMGYALLRKNAQNNYYQ